MVDGDQTAGGLVLTEKAHPELSIADLRLLSKRVRFLERYETYKEDMLSSPGNAGQPCVPTPLKRCLPRAAIEGAIIANVFRRSGNNAIDVDYDNLTEEEVKKWLSPITDVSDPVNKPRIENATRSVYWIWNEKFLKSCELLASEFATKLSDVGLQKLFSRQKKEIHRCLIGIIVEKIDYEPLKQTMKEQIEVSENVKKNWNVFLNSLYAKAMGLDVGGVRNEKKNAFPVGGRTKNPSAGPGRSNLSSRGKRLREEAEASDAKKRIPYVSKGYSASNQKRLKCTGPLSPMLVRRLRNLCLFAL